MNNELFNYTEAKIKQHINESCLKLTNPMKTLYERLKPEHKDVLSVEAEKYPAIAKSMNDELQRKRVILDLSYGCVVTISHTLRLKNSNIDTIMNLFEANELLNVNSK